MGHLCTRCGVHLAAGEDACSVCGEPVDEPWVQGGEGVPAGPEPMPLKGGMNWAIVGNLLGLLLLALLVGYIWAKATGMR